MSRRSKIQADPAQEAFLKGFALVQSHPLFQPLATRANVIRQRNDDLVPSHGWVTVTSQGTLHVHPTRRGTPEAWQYAIGHCLLHLGFDHFREHQHAAAWNAACDVTVAQFLDALKFGRCPDEYLISFEVQRRGEDNIYEELVERGGPPLEYLPDLVFVAPPKWQKRPIDWQAAFARGLEAAVTNAVEVASGDRNELASPYAARSPAQRAHRWFLAHYPFLGALAAGFRIIEDPLLCQRLDISIAAVDAAEGIIYLNPAAGLSEEECRFVIAHEILHVGLRHHARSQGRDHFLFNCAADYVINQWLLDMQVGAMPSMGLLYDPELKGLSAEAIYERIAGDLRLARKLATFRGAGQGDILDPGSVWWEHGKGLDLDAFYRRALAQGLEYHHSKGAERGLVPQGLEEEIRALAQPPIPWNVELAQWFDHFIALPDTRRSYARMSRRQSSTPDIPRPHVVSANKYEDGRTFGVVLDTSGSMDQALLGRALGAIASYAESREVPEVRVVFCDAAAYDAGYMDAYQIAGRVKIQGRGGTILQPGIELLERAKDFPRIGPILIITDAACDAVKIHAGREHAFLVPHGAQLPFVARGPVFRMPQTQFDRDAHKSNQ